MINIGGVSVRAFVVACRWARLQGYPNLLKDWTQEHSDKIQKVAEEYDRRHDDKESNTLLLKKAVEITEEFHD